MLASAGLYADLRPPALAASLGAVLVLSFAMLSRGVSSVEAEQRRAAATPAARLPRPGLLVLLGLVGAAAFLAAMTAARFGGDAIRARLGPMALQRVR